LAAVKRTITKQHAIDIAKKLKAFVRQEKAHAYADVFYKDRLIASFGIRRGSRIDAGHGHIPNDLHINSHQTRQLAACPLSRDEWLAILKEKGLLP
jgi:hypothetical protein